MPDLVYIPPPSLSWLQFDVLAAVATEGPKSIAEIAAASRVPKRTVSAVLTRLTRAGMAQKVQAGRGAFYQGTPLGSKVLSLYSGGWREMRETTGGE